ncbi:MAG: hypothetical protein M1817_006656 [Caeruleum heppii]|nr:MAG: hypothetical protein M1817_006656 [Caeruleum heppii]
MHQEQPVRPKIEELTDDDGDDDIGGEDEEEEERDGSVITSMSVTPGPSTDASSTPCMTIPGSSDSATTADRPVKRPRGRPRKHPLPSPEAQAKLAKGRSKTGCITCRRRKKKCDETKPQCLNCQKNAVVCEGYPERIVWKSGRQRAEEARAARATTRARELPVLIEGIETDIDQYFLHHFANNVSRVLTLFNDDDNPFKQLLLPMAVQHQGLMHALLCLSGSHLAGTSPQIFAPRREHHFQRACAELRTDPVLDSRANGSACELVEDSTIASIIILCLNSICAGETHGEYRPHLDAAKALIRSIQPPKSRAFSQFLLEFFYYHDTCGALTSLTRKPLMLHEDFQIPTFIVQPDAGALLGVLDGLFGYISQITRIRDIIRQRMHQNLEPLLDYQIVSDAVALDAGIRSWVSSQRPNTPRETAAKLYRQCTWIYLYRTIQPSRPSQKIQDAVDEGLEYLREIHPDASTQSVLLMPLFLLGCAAFVPQQRPDIRRAFGTLKRYSSLGNIEPAREVVETVWQRMDKGDESSWDWETIIQEMGYDFLIT